MKKFLFLALFMILCFGACSGIRLVSDYDEVIDNGITEFAEQLNTHVKNMGDLAGKPEGTYEANFRTYNALDSKLDVLIARASATSEGNGCKLQKKVLERIKSVLKDNMPKQLEYSDSEQDDNSYGCNEQLLRLVKQQLSYIETIHKETDKCGPEDLSCLRPQTVNTALKIANQSINAVVIVEAAKKE